MTAVLRPPYTAARTDMLMRNGVSIEIRRVTPDVAREFLATMVVNRSVKRRRLRQMVRDMLSDRFRFDGQPIRFDLYGHLYDGQHRLLALIEAGVSLDFVIVRGVTNDAALVTDTNAGPRTVADQFKIRGVTHYASIAGAITILWRYLHADIYNTQDGPTINEAEALLQEHAEMRQDVPPPVIGIGNALPVFLRHIVVVSERTTFDQFLHGVRMDDDLPETNPAIVLRRLLRNTEKGKVFMNRLFKQAAFFDAWNKYLNGANVTKLQIRARGGGLRLIMPMGTRFEPGKQAIPDE